MSGQLDIDWSKLRAPATVQQAYSDLFGPGPIAVAFREFHKANPHVYAELKRLAIRAVRRGKKRGSINQLFEVLRWELEVETEGSHFRINNNYRALYARLLMLEEPQLAGFFQTREKSPQVIE